MVVPAAGKRLTDPDRRRSPRFQPDWPEFYRGGLFPGRPSATAETPYNPLASGGSNLATSNPALDKAVSERVQALRLANPEADPRVPVELVTTSASGLDNNLTPTAALWQVPRVAKARNLHIEQVTRGE